MFTVSLFPSHWAACSDGVADFAQNYSTLSHAVVLILSNHLVAFGAFQCSQMGPHFEMLGPHSIVRKCLFVPGGTNKSVGYLYRQVQIRTVLVIVFFSGIYPGVLTPGDLGGLPSHIPTLPSLLGERNYSSLLLGKTKSIIC